MNKIEKSIIDSLNNVTSKKCDWKLFSTRYVKNDMNLNDRELKVYNSLSEFLAGKDTTITTIPAARFISMFIDWNNSKLIELPSVLVDIKTIEKCLKYYFLKNHLELYRYFCLSMNKKENVLYIVSVCRESGIYQIKENAAANNETENAAAADNSNISKISGHVSNIATLAANMTASEKIEIIKNLEKLLNVNATTTIIKKNKKSA